MATLVDVGTLAALFDLTTRRVQQLAADGTIPRAERGKYDLAHCVRAYVRFLRDVSEKSKRGPDPIQEARLKYENARAATAELELAERRRELVSAAEVEETWTKFVSLSRTKVLSVPAKTAQELAVASDPKECHAIVEEALYEALEALADTKIDPPPTE